MINEFLPCLYFLWHLLVHVKTADITISLLILNKKKVKFVISFFLLLPIPRSLGGDMTNVIKVTVLLSDISDYPSMNKIYSEYFCSATAEKPARAAFAVEALPLGAKIEIEAVAVLGNEYKAAS